MNRRSLTVRLAGPLVVVVMAGCGSNKQPGNRSADDPVLRNPEPAATTPVVQAPVSTTVAPKVAALREHDGKASLDIYSFDGGTLKQASTTELPAKDVFGGVLLWMAADRPVIVAAHTATGLWFGAVQDGTVSALSLAKKVSSQTEWSLIAARDGAAWIRHCAKAQVADEPCARWGYSRVWPSPRTATAVEAVETEYKVAPSSSVSLTPRETAPGSGYYVLECARAGARTTLFANDQHVAAAQVTWLSAEPPVALARISVAGAGTETGPNGTVILRGCTVEEVEGVTAGPDGWWGQPSAGKLAMWRGDVKVGDLDASAIAFAR